MTELTVDEIKRILPHRFPMLLVDRVTEMVPGERLTALKAVTVNEPWYQELDDKAPEEAYHYPSVLLAESWCQSAGVLAAWENPNPDVLSGQVMLFGGVSDVEYLHPVRPGDVLEHRVTLSRSFGDTLIFEGESLVGEQVVLRVSRVTMAMRPASELTGGAPGEQS
ncbi:3-hydroxyacyl-ACP dehydratase FabZ family protein [Streptomyces palmae]|uniref:Beta-hydroxyacyl-ACP dehydratase n=1 Tax=Streptomyces palmae TaxID=1701085 RepID=A0A4Z0GBT6_9ACTN|nr:beta-hydroxyacyl-ACP dehydratase [Streptomyces palmae]TGA92626.1 beta-hydroxyacyl-ACP dehydratase [Streptomyces palmae]